MTEDGYSASKVLTWVLGIIGSLAALGIASSVAMLIHTGNELTDIKATMRENREERLRQFSDLERRVIRLEEREDEE